MKLAVWMVLRDDEYYVDMAIKSVLPYVDGVYILDNGSTDSSIDVVKSFNSDKIYLEELKYDCSRPEPDSGKDSSSTHPYWVYDPSRDGNSLEAETRNKCMRGCIKMFQPDWLIQIDADEVYTPAFFEKVRATDVSKLVAIRHSTDRFVSKDRKGAAMSEQPNWDKFYDPHDRSWNGKLDIKWSKPAPGQSHVVPRFANGRSLTSVSWEGIYHIHLHRTFGPKSEIFWEVPKEPGVPYDPRVNKERFKWAYDNSVPANFDWKGLEFVIEKWEAWGIW